MHAIDRSKYKEQKSNLRIEAWDIQTYKKKKREKEKIFYSDIHAIK